jgi:hypothetical protein
MSKVEVTTQSNTKKIALSGHFTAMDHDQFRGILDDLQSGQGCTSCTVDLDHLDQTENGPVAEQCQGGCSADFGHCQV